MSLSETAAAYESLKQDYQITRSFISRVVPEKSLPRVRIDDVVFPGDYSACGKYKAHLENVINGHTELFTEALRSMKSEVDSRKQRMVEEFCSQIQ